MQAVYFPSTANQPTTYEFSNSVQVTVTHNKGYFPSVQVYINNTLVMADVTHIDENTFVVTFVNAKTGTILVR